MSRYPDRPNSALLVVDVQVGVMAPAPNKDSVVANVRALVDRARAEQVPVIWVQHSDPGMTKGSDDWQIVPELTPLDSEPVVHKTFGDSFAETDLEERLTEADAGRLVVVGAQTDACIRSTLHSALTRGYDATLVSDAHGTEDMREWGSPISPEQAVDYANLYWSFSKTHEAAGSVVATADLDFAAAAPPAGE